MSFQLSISDKNKLVNELLIVDPEATIKTFIEQVKEIEDEINGIN